MAAGAITLLGAAPASAITPSSWVYYYNTNVSVPGCMATVVIQSDYVSARENWPCAGSIYVRSSWTPNGINFYTSSWSAPNASFAQKWTSINNAAQAGH